MASSVEGKATLDDGLEVYTRSWSAAGNEQARILFIHGYSDHCNSYDFLFNYLTSRGISVHSFDQRGWGKTVTRKSDRGNTGPTTKVHADMSCMLRSTLDAGSTPLFLMGQSMGGAQVLTYSTQDPDRLMRRVRGTIALAPLVSLHPSTKPNAFTVFAGRLASKLLPTYQLFNPLDGSFLSHDPVANERWEHDELCHGTGTLQGLAGMLDRGIQLEKGNLVLTEGQHEGGKTRVLVVHGTGDKVNDFEASKTWVNRLPVQDKKLWSMDGWYHNMHWEPERETLSRGIADWILERAGEIPEAREATEGPKDPSRAKL